MPHLIPGLAIASTVLLLISAIILDRRSRSDEVEKPWNDGSRPDVDLIQKSRRSPGRRFDSKWADRYVRDRFRRP